MNQTFKNYKHIQEALAPKATEYGTNYPIFNNRKFTKKRFYETVFISGDDLYSVYITFSTDPDISQDVYFAYLGDIGKWDESKDFSDNLSFLRSMKQPEENKNAFRVFNNVFYVILEFLKKESPTSIALTGATPKLQKVYKAMFNNKNIQKIINKIGYEIEEDGWEYFFDKK